jgi:ferredoxin
MIRQVALNAGADACGFGDLNRFNGAPADMDPRYIFPKAKSIIGFLFRIPRGVQRGIEEGTQFYQYPSLAYGGINEIYAPAVIYELGKLIEDHGYEAVVYRNTGARGKISDMTGEEGSTISPEEHNVYERTDTKTAHHRSVQYTRPVAEDKRAPDLQFHFRIAGVICGLGEIGWSKMFLSPEFGPLVRLAFIFTDAILEPDQMYSGPPLCKKCMACAKECPGGCLSSDITKSNKIYIEGKLIEWAEYDPWKCYAFYTFPGRRHDPFIPVEIFEKHKDGKLALLEGKQVDANEKEVLKVYSVLEDYFPTWMGYNMAKCGGCIGACVNMLEKIGCLKDKFKEPLRRGKKRWEINR